MRRTLVAVALATLAAAPIPTGRAGGPDPAPSARGEVLAEHLVTVADDFIVDVWHNGEKVHDSRRTLLTETFGATAEKIDIKVREGDWVVFNVVNNRLRWGGASYFGVAGIRPGSGAGFVTETRSGRWSACDAPEDVRAFIARRDRGAGRKARPVEVKWAEGDAQMNGLADGWAGEAVWGESRNTWIKYVAPRPGG